MRRVPQLQLLPSRPTLPLVAVSALILAGGLALAAVQPGQPSHTTHKPATNQTSSDSVRATSGSSSASPSPATSPTPNTSGLATQATTPKSTPNKQTSTSATATPGSNFSPTQAQPQVALTLIEPDGTFTFNVALSANQTLCDNLTTAKSAGQIRSVTLDYSFLATFHSVYVREINGYQNNWIVKVNGTSPKGCSLYQPKEGDRIEWKFQ